MTSADPNYIPSSLSPEIRPVNLQTDFRSTLRKAANTQTSYQNAATLTMNSRSGTTIEQLNSQGKKGTAVESYFCDKKFSGAPEQSLNNFIGDFEIRAAQ